jgi:hypothetical protein
MTKRLIASSLAAAFAFGTAFGLAISQAENTNCTKRGSEMLLDHFGNSLPGRSSQLPAAPEKQQDGLTCLENGGGKALCWPKGSEPGAGSETACVERDGTTLCVTKPKISPPSLDL